MAETWDAELDQISLTFLLHLRPDHFPWSTFWSQPKGIWSKEY